MSSDDYSARVSQLKANLRRSLQISRPQISSGLTERIIELVKVTKSKRVGCYVSKAGEPETLSFLEWSTGVGIEVYTPAIFENSLRWRRYSGEISIGRYGIGESTGSEISPNDLELMFIPAIAATRSGNRLGRGGGYFDRELNALRNSPHKSRPIIAAIVFDNELLDSLPTEAHDEPVDFVVTPSKVISCKSEKPNEEI